MFYVVCHNTFFSLITVKKNTKQMWILQNLNKQYPPIEGQYAYETLGVVRGVKSGNSTLQLDSVQSMHTISL